MQYGAVPKIISRFMVDGVFLRFSFQIFRKMIILRFTSLIYFVACDMIFYKIRAFLTNVC